MSDKKQPIDDVSTLEWVNLSSLEELSRRSPPSFVKDYLASMQVALNDAYRRSGMELTVSESYRYIREEAEKKSRIEPTLKRVASSNIYSVLGGMKPDTGIINFLEKLTATDSFFLDRAKILERYLSINASTAKSITNLGNIREYMAAIGKSDEWISSSKTIFATFERLKNQRFTVSTQSYLEFLAEANEHYDAAELSGNSLPVDVKGVSDKVALLVQDVADEISKALTFQEAADQIIIAIRDAKEPLHQKILWLFLIPLVISFFFSFLNPYVDFYLKKSLENTPIQEANKLVKEAARETVGDLRLLREYRFVASKTLSVMRSPRSKSQVLGQLRFGQTVHVLEKERDFTLVVWRSEDGDAELKGWVFSRYLKRFQ